MHGSRNLKPAFPYSSNLFCNLSPFINASFDRYSCKWGGLSDGKSVVSGLDRFGVRVLNNLWNAIQKLYPDEV